MLRLLDGDDAFLADLVHRLGDQLADGRVSRGDRGGGSDLLLGLDLLGVVEQLGGDGLDGLLDAALQRHRVGAGRDVAQAFAHQRLGQHGGGGGAVTGDVVGLLGNFLDELGPDLLVRVLQLDFLGDRHTIVGDGGRAPLLLQDDVAAARPQGHPDGVGEDVHPALEPATRFLVESDQLGHEVLYPPDSPGPGGRCRARRPVRSAAWMVTGRRRCPRRTSPANGPRPSVARTWRTLTPPTWHSTVPECQFRFSTRTGRVQGRPWRPAAAPRTGKPIVPRRPRGGQSRGRAQRISGSDRAPRPVRRAVPAPSAPRRSAWLSVAPMFSPWCSWAPDPAAVARVERRPPQRDRRLEMRRSKEASGTITESGWRWVRVRSPGRSR